LHALRQSKGCVIMVSSAAGLMAGPTQSLVHAVAKAGLVGMTRSLALELAPDQVRVNCVCPGYVDTADLRARNLATHGTIERSVSRAVPLNRMATARECASAIAYLASDDAAYSTGSAFVTDGGCLAQASFGARE
jgi:NAD(P)-dependent dehydrogenase (short-subunit alcohol dehydrogenase family)